MKTFTPAVAAMAVAAFVLPVSAQEAAFTLPELGYEYDALAPVIDAETMELHHSRHHQTFVDNLNNAVEAGTIEEGATVEELVATASMQPMAVRNSAGGHWNHTFFWEIIGPVDEAGEPSEDLTAAIDAVYGSMDEFKAEFEAAGAAQFGSGWVWLIVNDAGELEITSTPNQDNPLMDLVEVQGTPVIGNDVWEHAYYLTYNNRRADYLSSWWDVVNWEEVSAKYAEAVAE
jgi:superoxide dismutase, Fe-Mn family